MVVGDGRPPSGGAPIFSMVLKKFVMLALLDMTFPFQLT
jgi:hypothetical protein